MDLERIVRRILDRSNYRHDEYSFALKQFAKCQRVLDVGCGTGTFIALDPNRIAGLDLNPENVDFCKSRGLNAEVGNALDLPYEDETFDGVHSSHLLQVFDSGNGVKLIKELCRVVRPGGVVVITALSDFRRFFRHPENARPWPPDAIFRLFHKQRGAQSPMYPGMPLVEFGAIRRRHPPLLEFEFPSTYWMQRYCGVLNAVQYALGLRKYWTFDAYSLALLKTRAMIDNIPDTANPNANTTPKP